MTLQATLTLQSFLYPISNKVADAESLRVGKSQTQLYYYYYVAIWWKVANNYTFRP